MDDETTIRYQDSEVLRTLEEAERRATEWEAELRDRGYQQIMVEIERDRRSFAPGWRVSVTAFRTLD